LFAHVAFHAMANSMFRRHYRPTYNEVATLFEFFGIRMICFGSGSRKYTQEMLVMAKWSYFIWIFTSSSVL